MIEVSKLNQFFGSFHALKDVSFTVSKGSIAGFIGPNGAGKSTTLRTLAGVLPLTSGVVVLDGVSLAEAPIEARKKLGYMQETPVLYRELKVCEYLEFVASIKGISKSECRDRVQIIMKRCGVHHIQTRLIGNVSKGNRQRIALAQALIAQPKVLLLDEPTSAMDPSEVIRIRAFISELKDEMAILLSSHILSEVAQICDHIIFIREGKICYQGSIQEVESVIQKAHQTVALRFRGPVEEFFDSIQKVPGGQVVSMDGMFVHVLVTDDDQFYPALYKVVGEKGIPLREVVAREHRLESLFSEGHTL